MRPVLKLIGRGEIHAAGTVAQVKLTRKIWYVLALLATAPDTEMLRSELTEIAWPLSDDRSRDVLMHKWRKTVVDAFAQLGAHPVIVISERVVKLDTTLIKVDYLECLRLGNIILSSVQNAETLQSALEFDDLATDQILIAGHPDAFETQREAFDALRIQSLERGWQAAVACRNDEAAARFSDRLRTLGFTGSLTAEQLDAPQLQTETTRQFDSSRPIAAILLAGLLCTPFVLGKLSQPPAKQNMTGSPIPDQPPTYIGRFIQYEFQPRADDDVVLSEAVSTVQTQNGDAITTGVIRYKNREQQILTVKTSRSRKLLWSSVTPREPGRQYIPEHITTDKFGNIFVGAHVYFNKHESQQKHRGHHLALLKYSADGKRVSTHISKTADDKVLHKVRVASDLDGGAWLFTTGSADKKSVTLRGMHLMASGKLEEKVTFGTHTSEFTSLAQGTKGEIYLASTVYNAKNPNNTSDWQVQKLARNGHLEWTRIIDSPAHLNDFGCELSLSLSGDVLVNGPLATETLDGVIRNLPTVIRLDPTTGRTRRLDQTQTHFLNSNVMLAPLPSIDMYVLGIYDLAQQGSNSVYFYRSRPSDDFSSLALSIGLPKRMKAKRIIGMYFRGTNGSFSALLQPVQSPGQNLALIYLNKYSGTDITTGMLTTDKAVNYNQSNANIVAGRFGKNFTVFDFSGLR